MTGPFHGERKRTGKARRETKERDGMGKVRESTPAAVGYGL